MQKNLWLSNALIQHIKSISKIRSGEIVKSVISVMKRIKKMPEPSIFIHSAIDSEIKKLSGLTCRMGCSNCCHNRVMISPKELKNIPELSDEDKSHLLNQSTFTDLEWETKPKEQTRCVFLKNNACSIYSSRPGACRSYVNNTDPSDCIRLESKKFICTEAEILSSANLNLNAPIYMHEFLLSYFRPSAL